jgi:predicted MFS family arabinose efflux permease
VRGSAIGITVAAGPVPGGLLVSGIGWRSVFWVNVPIGIAAILLTRRFVPESKAARGRAFDPPGQALVIVLLASITVATIEGPRRGWAGPWIVGLFVLAVLGLTGMLIVEPRRSGPLIDLRFSRSPPSSGANTISVVMPASPGGLLFLNTLYLQDRRHFSPLHAGLMIIPLAVGQAVAANLSGRLVAPGGARLPLTLGGALLAIGGFLLVPLTAHTESVCLLATYATFGLGAGMVSPPVTSTAISGLPPDQVGDAGALAASARQFGISIGVAVTGSIRAAAEAGVERIVYMSWPDPDLASPCSLTAEISARRPRGTRPASRSRARPASGR